MSLNTLKSGVTFVTAVLHCVTVLQKPMNLKSILIRQNENTLINVKLKLSKVGILT